MLRLSERLPRPSGFATRIGFNGLAQIAPIVASLAITPVLIDRLGADRFGIWSLALIILSTLVSLDAGVSASLGRYFAAHAARNERVEAGRMLVGSLVFFLLLGVVATLVAYVLAPVLVGVFNVPADLESEAIWALRWLPPLAVVALAGNASAALLQGNGMFRELALATATSAGVFVVAVVVLVNPGADLPQLFVAAAMRYAVIAVGGVILARKHIVIRRPLLPSLSTLRELGRYSTRMQLVAMTGFVNAELDGFVIAAVAPVRYVGLYSIGLQAASAARSVPLYAFSPLLTRLTTTFRSEGRQAAAVEFDYLERRWLPSVLGYGVLALSAIGFSVTIWLGDDYVLSGVVAVVLLTGYIVHVGLTGMRTCYVRAIGRPGLEARYSTVWTVCNAALTIPLALVAGMVGVVSATAATGIVASVYFVFLCKWAERLPFYLPGLRWWLIAAGAACVTVLGEVLVLRTGIDGFVGLVASGIPPLVALSIAVPFERRRFRSSDAALQRFTPT